MREITEIRELQEIELDILVYIDKVCREHGLKYFLAYGTLLGAIRHKGFIPWDDDIDILMPREDYEEFCTLLSHEKGRYRLLEWKRNKGYIYAFAKVVDTKTCLKEKAVVLKSRLGVYVDVFPYDGWKGKKQVARADFLGRIHNWKIRGFKSMRHNENRWKNIPRYFLWILLKALSQKNLLRLTERNARSLASAKPNRYGAFCCGADTEKCVFQREDVEKCIEAPFEGHLFYIPEGYDHLLKNTYGDYMQLPPEDQRVSGHDYRAYWI